MTELTQVSEVNIQAQNVPIQVQEDPPMTKMQLIKKLWSIGFITFGGPMSHVGVFRKIFIDDLNAISNEKFTQLLTLCQSLPGPTSTQLIIALSMYSTFSWFGGLLAFIIFSLPTFIIMNISAFILIEMTDMERVQQILAGFRIISVAIILQAFWNLSEKYRSQSRMVLLFTCSMVIYYFVQSSITIVVMFVCGGIFNLITDSSKVEAQESVSSKRFSSFPYGFKNMFLFIVGLVVAFIITFDNSPVQYFIWSTFYKIGSLVIGGGHVILPLMLTSFESYHLFSQQQYWNGFSVISCMPGPMFNLSVYIGTISTQTILGGISSFLGLYIPCFLFVSFALPLWQRYRKGSKIQKFLNGVCCVSVGLILATCIILYTTVIKDKQQSSLFFTLLIVGSYYLLHKKFSIVQVLIIGQVAYLTFLIVKQLIQNSS